MAISKRTIRTILSSGEITNETIELGSSSLVRKAWDESVTEVLGFTLRVP